MQNPPNEPQPSYPPQAPPPKKRSRGKFFAIGCGSLILLLAIIGIVIAATSAGSGNSNNTQATAPSAPTTQATQPTQAPQHWTTTHTFTGNGTKKTAIFTVPDDWKLLWKCDPSSFYGNSYNVIVDVNGSDGSPVDPGAVNTICKAGNTGDSTEEHQGGQVYLDINSEGAWTITVQELR